MSVTGSWQADWNAVEGTSVQLFGETEPDAPEFENVTVPLGDDGLELMSLTVAVQLETWLTTIVEGVQSTVVVVVCMGAGEVAIRNETGPLAEWSVSP